MKNASENDTQTDSVMLVSSENMTYDSDNRLTSYNGKEVIYDEKGNMTYGPSSLITDTDKAEFYEYTYDCRNRLIKAGNEKDGYTEYSYDAENNRIELKTKDYTKDYVVESASSEYSRVLSETITYTKDKTKNNIKYVYGNGLISEYNGNLISNYHFNHLGSTIAITDKDGKITNRYEYGVYGNLTAKNSDNKEFLYNGEYGVITDENNLYYMRSRYYNPVIKRFINRDIVAGEMTNSKSLNRFAYVQGNPVSYTDPFGLSPSGNSHSFKNLIHSVLDVLGMIPGIGEIFDLANAAMYLVEGNYKMAGLSLLGALPLIGNMVGGIRFAEGCVKLTKAANVISKTLKYASIIGSIAVAGYTAFTAGKDIYQGVKNHDLTLGRVIADVLSIGISAAGIGFGLKELGSNIKDDFGIDLKENFKEFLHDNRGCVDLDAFTGGSKGRSDRFDRAGYQSGERSNNLFGRDRQTRNTVQYTEWRRSINKNDIHDEIRLFLGDDFVKVDAGKWRSLDGTRQFRVKPGDYLGKHPIGQPSVPNTPHVHLEFLSPRNNGNGFDVIKNVHVPLVD